MSFTPDGKPVDVAPNAMSNEISKRAKGKLESMIERRVSNYVEDVRVHGRDRATRLLINKNFPEADPSKFDEFTLEDVISALETEDRRLARVGENGHWSYSFNKHVDVKVALEGERRMLSALRTTEFMEAAE
ncbi:MAG: hypothetical protein AAF468_06350 [Pseudomonadota bacterium]